MAEVLVAVGCDGANCERALIADDSTVLAELIDSGWMQWWNSSTRKLIHLCPDCVAKLAA